MKKPFFTILTSTYNASHAIEIAAASVRGQHRDDVEYIVIDGASTDDTLDYIGRNRDVITKVISEPDKGIYDALNKGIRAASGTLIGIIGCDDSLVPGALDAVERQFRREPAEIYAGQTLLTDASGRGVLREDEDYGPGALISGIPFGHNAMFATREAYGKVGLYDQDFRITADANWVHRAIRAGLTCSRIDRVLVQFATTGVSSNDGERVLEESGRAIRANFPFLSQQDALDLLYGVRGWSGPEVLTAVLVRHEDPALHAAVAAALQARPAALAAVAAHLRAGTRLAVPAKEERQQIPSSKAPLISFIVPAYNVAGYIERCLSSLTEQQALRDIEVIVVDDGSTDATAAIVETCRARDARIELISQENAGQGAARAEAIKRARGQFVWCVDSDDRIQPRVLERLLNIFDTHADIDLIVLNYAYEEESGDLEFSSLVPPRLGGKVVHPLESEETFSAISSWTCPPWRFLIKRDFLVRHKITFHPGFFYEDHAFAIDVMSAAKKAYVDTSVSYYYLRRPGSTVRSLDRRCFDFIPIRRLVLDRLGKRKLLNALPAMTSSYVVPIDFIRAHVPQAVRAEFLGRVREDTSKAELEVVRKFGSRDERRLLEAGDVGHAAEINFANLQSGYSRIGSRLEISRTLGGRAFEGLLSVEGPYPEIGLPERFCWVSGRQIDIAVDRRRYEDPRLVLRVRTNLPNQFLVVQQNGRAIEVFPCRSADFSQHQDIAVRLVDDDHVAVSIELAVTDGGPRDLSLILERVEVIEAEELEGPDFDLMKWAKPALIEKGARTRLEAINVDVRVDRQPRAYLRIGDEAHVGGTFVFERGLGEITIGNRSSIGGGCLLICTQEEGIHIGDNVMLSWNVTVIDSNSHSTMPGIRANDAFDWMAGEHMGRIGHYKDWSNVDSAPIRIMDDAWIGFGSAIMKGVTIGRGAIVGSNSVVTKDVPDGAIVAGNPARVVGQVPAPRYATLASTER